MAASHSKPHNSSLHQHRPLFSKILKFQNIGLQHVFCNFLVPFLNIKDYFLKATEFGSKPLVKSRIPLVQCQKLFQQYPTVIQSEASCSRTIAVWLPPHSPPASWCEARTSRWRYECVHCQRVTCSPHTRIQSNCSKYGRLVERGWAMLPVVLKTALYCVAQFLALKCSF